MGVRAFVTELSQISSIFSCIVSDARSFTSIIILFYIVGILQFTTQMSYMLTAMCFYLASEMSLVGTMYTVEMPFLFQLNIFCMLTY